MKFCRDCVHLKNDLCMRDRKRQFDLVTGEERPGGYYNKDPWIQRLDGFIDARLHGTCGREGRWFTPRSGRRQAC